MSTVDEHPAHAPGGHETAHEPVAPAVDVTRRPAIDELRARDRLDEHAVDAFLAAHTSPIVEGDAATFLYRGHAERVLLHHRVVGLPPAIELDRVGDTSLFAATVQLPPGSRVEYHYEVIEHGHGRRLNDPLNPHVARNPMGSASVARAEGYAVPDWVRHDPEARPGALDELVVQSAALDREMHTRLYLPARFRRTHRYPLLVVHDGGDYLEFTQARTVLDNLVHRLEIAEVVAVFTTSPDRLVEYADDERHHRFLLDELIPELEQMLPLIGQPRGRCLVGSSFGGIASFSAALHAPGTIGSLLLESASFLVRDFDDDEVPAVFDPIVAMLQRYREDPVRVADRIYQTCGAFEPMIAGNRAMVPVLQSTGAQLRYVEARDGHNWENWRDRLRDGLSWLFPGPQKYVYE